MMGQRYTFEEKERFDNQKGRLSYPARNAVGGIVLTFAVLVIFCIATTLVYIAVFMGPEITMGRFVCILAFYALRTIFRDIWEQIPFE